MDEAKFWKLIDAAREEGGGGADMDSANDQADCLVNALVHLPPEEVIEFEKLLNRKTDDAYVWKLWGAAYVINGGCSDDGFEYFRGWLVGRGKKVYEDALANPESLANIADGEAECEDMLYVARRAYERMTGKEMPADHQRARRKEPSGEQWEEDSLGELFPKLAAKFG